MRNRGREWVLRFGPFRQRVLFYYSREARTAAIHQVLHSQEGVATGLEDAADLEGHWDRR